jgi:cyclopropane-fatty-acyl-phospholipid synthase
VHIFCHRKYAYLFETEGPKNWMGRTFFSGGIMPSEDLLERFQRDLNITRRWWIRGDNYAKTCEAWLSRLDENHREAERILSTCSNGMPSRVQLQRWRIFFMACAELFAFDGDKQWGVAHYLWQPNSPGTAVDRPTT